MIEWKKYIDHKPEYGKEYLVYSEPMFSDDPLICVASLTKWKNKDIWQENIERTSVNNVTHYAEINFPE